MELRGTTALITGAALRIGREIALTLARRGAAVIVHYRASAAPAKTLVREIKNLGSEGYLVQADFSPPKAGNLFPVIKRLMQDIDGQVPRVDILINNASIFYPIDFDKITEQDWDDFMSVNLKVPFLLSQEMGLRMCRQKKGKIINLVDWTGIKPKKHFLPYCASKAALINLTEGLAKVLAPYVQVNGIAPGPILPAKGMTEKQKKEVARKTLLKRFGDPRDIAETVRFLIEGSDYITGAVIPVEGGSLLV